MAEPWLYGWLCAGELVVFTVFDGPRGLVGCVGGILGPVGVGAASRGGN